jgi:peptidoglycan biosynthesis protein MviN/MurJ (putative lipid II flippase)
MSIASGVVGGQTFVLLERAFAASLGVGAVSTISYARGVVFTPMIMSQAIAMGLYPAMVRAHEARDPEFVRDSFFRGLRMTLLAAGTAVIFLLIFGGDLVRVLLQRGELSSHDATAVTHSLLAFTPAVAGTMLLIITSRAFYAIDWFRGLIWSQCVVLVFYIPLAFILRGDAGATGLALSFGIAELAGGLAATWMVAKRTHAGWADARKLRSVAPPLLLVLATVGATRILLDNVSIPGDVDALVESVLGGAVALIAATVYLIHSNWPEARVLQARLPGGRLHRGVAG